MIYRDFGKTGEKVSALGFGGMRFKKEDYQDGKIQKAVDLVLYAYEKGITYFDSAPSYCDSMSETIIGEAVKQMKGKVYVTTKAAPHITLEKTADEMLKGIEKSLKKLGVDQIDFMHIWCVLNYEMYQSYSAPNGPIEGIKKAKELGMVKHVNLSTHASGSEVSKMLDSGDFEGVLLGYNATNFPFRKEGVESAKRLNCGVVTMNPLGGGLIAQNTNFYDFLKNGDPDDTSARAAIRFNASHPEITVTLVGFSNTWEIDEAVAAMAKVKEIDSAEKARLEAHLSSNLNELCTGCGYCKGCPVDIDIPKFMDAYNLSILTGETKSAVERLKFHWQLSKDTVQDFRKCIACGKCEKICTQKLPIIERMGKLGEYWDATKA